MSRRPLIAVAVVLFSLPVASQTITYVAPYRDASQMYPEIEQLILTANKYVHLVMWGFDDELRLAPNTQFPALHSRTRVVPNRTALDDPEDLGCRVGSLASLPAGPVPGKPLDPHSAIYLLRCKAAEMAFNNASDATTEAAKDAARGEVMVLVWHNVVDSDSLIPVSALDDLGYLMVDRATLAGWNKQQLMQEMRRRGSGESLDILLEMQRAYRAAPLNGINGLVPMPTGVLVMTQLNRNTTLTASHHQKLLLTDKGAYIGGINFLKEYWDTPEHGNPSALRWSSGVPPQALTGGPGVADFNGPLHDTGTIVKGTIIAGLNATFLERWNSNITNWYGEPVAKRPYRTPYGALKQAIRTRYAGAAALNPFVNQAVNTLLQKVSSFEKLQHATSPSGTPTPVFVPTIDPSLLTGEIVYRVSRPKRSYRGTASPQEIRDEYYQTIQKFLKGVSSLGYFENQYFDDHDFTIRLYNACQPAQTHGIYWCRRDPYLVIALPYQPAGFGLGRLDDVLVTGPTVKRETQNLLWLETRTARTVLNRASRKPIATLEDPPPCASCNSRLPYIKFADLSVEKDPAKLTLQSGVNFFGTTGYGPPQKCEPGNPNSIEMRCPIQQAFSMPVGDIITDAAAMSYSLVASTAAAPAPATSPSVQAYDDFMAANGIYIHSKFSAFFGRPGGVQSLRYVVGSANINTRSLGVQQGRPKEPEDSESAIFWTPADDGFWRDLMIEHLGALDPVASPMSAADEWSNQGWRNLELISRGGAPPPNQRVVRLDLVARCMRISACP